jgi:hypothetical protein
MEDFKESTWDERRLEKEKKESQRINVVYLREDFDSTFRTCKQQLNPLLCTNDLANGYTFRHPIMFQDGTDNRYYQGLITKVLYYVNNIHHGTKSLLKNNQKRTKGFPNTIFAQLFNLKDKLKYDMKRLFNDAKKEVEGDVFVQHLRSACELIKSDGSLRLEVTFKYG